jgi:protein phosphatase
MGSGLQRPVMVKISERCGNPTFRVGSANVNGFRDSNEDAHLVMLRPNGSGFFAVFDGHAGVDCANFMRDRFTSKLESMSFPLSSEQLTQLAVDSDAEFLKEHPMSCGGSTGTFFCGVRERRGEGEEGGPAGEEVVRMTVGNVGDSRVLVFDGEKCVPLTKDHKPSDPEEKARIEKYGGYTSGNRVDGNLAVSRAFGDKDFKNNASAKEPGEQKVIAVPEITTATLPWNTGCFAVVCCDGVFESYFSNEQVIEFIRNELKTRSDLAVIAGKVCHAAVDRGSRDNVTCMIVQFADGSDLPMVPVVEAIPGPWHSPQHTMFRDIYEKSCLYCNTPIEVVLERRFDELISVPWASLPSDMRYELLGFLRDGALPPIVGFNAEKGPERTQWFKDYFEWAKTYKNEYGTQAAFEPPGLQEAQRATGVLPPPQPADAAPPPAAEATAPAE